MIGPFGPDLARLLPRLRARLPGLPEPVPLDPATERRHLFDAVISVVRRLAARGPVLLVLDDLHWADRSSLLLARQLVRAAPLGPVLLLGTFRDDELAERHPLPEVLADLEREQPRAAARARRALARGDGRAAARTWTPTSSAACTWRPAATRSSSASSPGTCRRRAASACRAGSAS